jgi:hypothetical protein
MLNRSAEVRVAGHPETCDELDAIQLRLERPMRFSRADSYDLTLNTHRLEA